MTEPEYRQTSSELELRSMSKRLLCGILVPYGVNQRINESLVERFEPGVFIHQFRAAHRIRLLNLHSRDPGHMQLGHGMELRDASDGLWGEFRVVEGPFGDHYLSLAREGSLRQWSIGFIPESSRMDGYTKVHVKASVFETALVPEGAYGERAAIAAVRKDLPVLTRDNLLARLPKPHFPA